MRMPLFCFEIFKIKDVQKLKHISKLNRTRIVAYRRFLYILLSGGVFLLALSAYYFVWSSVPSTIVVKAGVEQTLDFQVPVSGKLYKEAVAVSGQAANKKTEKSIDISFGRPVTVKANQIDSYKMDLKLFGIFPLKDVNVQVIQDVRLKPAGIPIGIYVKTKGVLIVGIGDFEGDEGQTYNPAKYILQTGDYILEINDEEITGKKQMIELINHSDGQEMIFTIKRGDLIFQVKAKPEMNQSGEYKMGIWVRDNAQGVGTMTYIDENGGFGALGHGINDIDTSTLMALDSGTLYHTEIIGITRGSSGSPGELTGFIEYDDRNVMGAITENTAKGIFGICTPEITENAEYEYMEIGLKQEIQKGPAQIICSIGNGTRIYEIEIKEINLENDNINRGIVLEITDKELLSATGGIVQGMSGSPIIQDGKIIGAVTHVLVQDPSKGYGIFIENMLTS